MSLQHVEYRHGLAANRMSITPHRGEPLWDYDTKRLYVGDGITVGGISIAGPSLETVLYGNVNCTPPINDGDILMYDNSVPEWKNTTLTLANIHDVNFGTASDQQMLKFDASSNKWINFSPNFNSSALSEFDLTGSTNGDTLVFNNNDSEYQPSNKINVQDDIVHNVETGYKHIFKINGIEVASVDQYGLAGAHYNSDYAETFLTDLLELPDEGTPVGLNNSGKVITLENELIGTSNFIGLISYHPGHILGPRKQSGWEDTLNELHRIPVALFGQILVDLDINDCNSELIINMGQLIKREKYHSDKFKTVAKTLYRKNRKMLVLIRGGI